MTRLESIGNKVTQNQFLWLSPFPAILANKGLQESPSKRVKILVVTSSGKGGNPELFLPNGEFGSGFPSYPGSNPSCFRSSFGGHSLATCLPSDLLPAGYKYLPQKYGFSFQNPSFEHGKKRGIFTSSEGLMLELGWSISEYMINIDQLPVLGKCCSGWSKWLG